ncbi:MAG TPA: rhodanese-like domain-containing protein [Armatimonadota bacterium]|nr:rhodanese-like domain-containing protein [Armatimonadota bacterium]
MYVQQFFTRGLAHSSYLLGDTKTCAIVDPRRDIDIYLEAASAMGMTITHILETHLHADFVSGHMDLARVTGATIYVPKAGSGSFDSVAVGQGDSFQIGNLSVEVRDTPGHTPEHISYVVADRSRGDQPVSVFCGDTLFVGDVGRPDLFPGQARDLASRLYDSLHQQLLTLPAYCEVYPAHGAGSLCGRAMGAKRTSTVGYEALYNPALALTSREEFITSLTTNMPGAPDHFSRCSAINGAGPAVVADLPPVVPLAPKAFRDRAAGEDSIVLDIRSYEAFGGAHIPGAYHISLAGNFATFAGWILPPDKDILIVSDDSAPLSESVTWLRRVGLDRVVGSLAGGMTAWSNAGYELGHLRQVGLPELQAMVSGGSGIVLVDTRAPNEFAGGHIDGAINIPAPDLRTRYVELDPEQPTVLTCNSGNRSSLGAALLLQRGFKKLLNAAGGMTAWTAAGLGPECARCVAPHGPRFAATQ